MECSGSCGSGSSPVLVPVLSVLPVVVVMFMVFIIIVMMRRCRASTTESIQMNEVVEVDDNTPNPIPPPSPQFQFSTNSTVRPFDTRSTLVTQPMVLMSQNGEPVVVQVAFI
eukprot:TRINITY_DN6122_c0_g2_i4.p1 TRINITY_DN6122_c0_g2~~TRINITY_DN6122_c0_g2_i4.p1  ORF type:complete len:112 (-),score=27.68 TRINITY_DN6122_c0_g2_i4:108-443(-)